MMPYFTTSDRQEEPEPSYRKMLLTQALLVSPAHRAVCFHKGCGIAVWEWQSFLGNMHTCMYKMYHSPIGTFLSPMRRDWPSRLNCYTYLQKDLCLDLAQPVWLPVGGGEDLFFAIMQEGEGDEGEGGSISCP